MKEGKNITTLFLDIGGVLLTNGWREEYHHLVPENIIWINQKWKQGTTSLEMKFGFVSHSG